MSMPMNVQQQATARNTCLRFLNEACVVLIGYNGVWNIKGCFINLSVGVQSAPVQVIVNYMRSKTCNCFDSIRNVLRNLERFQIITGSDVALGACVRTVVSASTITSFATVFSTWPSFTITLPCWSVSATVRRSYDKIHVTRFVFGVAFESQLC